MYFVFHHFFHFISLILLNVCIWWSSAFLSIPSNPMEFNNNNNNDSWVRLVHIISSNSSSTQYSNRTNWNRFNSRQVWRKLFTNKTKFTIRRTNQHKKNVHQWVSTIIIISLFNRRNQKSMAISVKLSVDWGIRVFVVENVFTWNHFLSISSYTPSIVDNNNK